jgi:hypothetical protein
MNVGCLSETIFEEDLIYLIGYWRLEEKFCDDVKKITLDCGTEFVIFEGVTMSSLAIIFLQSPYLALIINENDYDYVHSGEKLDIPFLLNVNWTYEI